MLFRIKNSPMCVANFVLGLAVAFSWLTVPAGSVHGARPFSTADVVPCDATTTLLESEYLALQEFYNQLGGPNWANRTNWGNPNVAVDDWYGVACRDGHITRLQFTSNNLSGSLPGAALEDFTNLEVLAIYNDNSVTGGIPPELGNLAYLQDLRLVDNGISGPIPSELEKLTNLEVLSFAEGGFSGEIPHWINKLSKLREIHFYNNRMSGSIPTEICDLSNLVFLRILGIGGMSGPMPDCLRNLHQLQYLDLSWIGLTGPIPDIFDDLPELITLDLEMNYLEGPIPESITHLSHLMRFDPVMWAIYETNLNYNMLTANSTTDAFLYNFDHNWKNSQTVPPADLQANSLAPNSVTLSWTPITNDPPDGGYYTIYYAAQATGPWLAYDRTVTKIQANMDVENLLSGVPYYFKVNTFTPALYPQWGQLPWTSQFSDVVSTTTLAGGIQTAIDPADTSPKTLLYVDANGATTTITVPSGAASQAVTLSYVPITTLYGFNFTDQSFTLTAFKDNLPLAGYAFNQPVTMQVGYTHDDLNGIQEDALVVKLYDSAQRIWKEAADSCSPPSTYQRNPDENWVKVNVCHLTRFVLSDPKLYRFALPLLRKN